MKSYINSPSVDFTIYAQHKTGTIIAKIEVLKLPRGSQNKGERKDVIVATFLASIHISETNSYHIQCYIIGQHLNVCL